MTYLELMARNPLAAALLPLVERLTTEQLAEATGASRSTAALMAADLRADDPSTRRWDGDRLLAFATWERRTYDTTTIADALRGTERPDASQATAVGQVRAALEQLAGAAEQQARLLREGLRDTSDGHLTYAEAERLQERIAEVLESASAARSKLVGVARTLRALTGKGRSG